tara:strand:+ start:673 stop:2346 length:1674 start_codon:yes stop_codon:yes gene_type:complete
VIKFLKLLFFIITFCVLLIAVSPFFIDKEKIAGLVEKKIRDDLNINLTFDKNIDISVIPYPSVNIFSLKFEDKKNKVDVFAEKLNVILSWTSLFNFSPEIKSLEIFSPVINYEKKNKTADADLLIQVNNYEKSFYEKTKFLLQSFDLIKIYDALLNYKETKISNLDLILKGKEKVKIKGNLNLVEFKSKIIFDFLENTNDSYNFIIQQKIADSNKIDYRGKLSFDKKDFFLNGNAKSKIIDLDKVFPVLTGKPLTSRKFKINPVKMINNKEFINLNFSIEELKFQKINLSLTKFKLKYFNNAFIVEDFKTKLKDSNVNGNLNYDPLKKSILGKLDIKNFLIEKSYFGLTKIDLIDGLVDCSIKYKILLQSNDFKKLINNLNSKGKCDAKNVKMSGIDITSIAQKVDKVTDFKSLVNVINNKNFGKESQINKITTAFNIDQGFLNIKSLKAYHQNLVLDAEGKYNINKDFLSVNSQAFFQTKKYKNLPPLGIIMKGPSKDIKISYDFENLKQKLFNEGLKKILEKKKTITVDPDTFKQFFGDEFKKNFSPEKIIDLFN